MSMGSHRKLSKVGSLRLPESSLRLMPAGKAPELNVYVLCILLFGAGPPDPPASFALYVACLPGTYELETRSSLAGRIGLVVEGCGELSFIDLQQLRYILPLTKLSASPMKDSAICSSFLALRCWLCILKE